MTLKRFPPLRPRPLWLKRLREQQRARWEARRAFELRMERLGFVIDDEQILRLRPGAVIHGRWTLPTVAHTA